MEEVGQVEPLTPKSSKISRPCKTGSRTLRLRMKSWWRGSSRSTRRWSWQDRWRLLNWVNCRTRSTSSREECRVSSLSLRKYQRRTPPWSRTSRTRSTGRTRTLRKSDRSSIPSITSSRFAGNSSRRGARWRMSPRAMSLKHPRTLSTNSSRG